MRFCATLVCSMVVSIQAFGAKSPVRDVMNEIFANVAFLLPYAVGGSEPLPMNSKTDQVIHSLKQQTAKLESLARTHGEDFHFLAKGLDRDLRDVVRFYERKQGQRAAFVLQNMTERCFACHSKYPDNKAVPSHKKFFASIGYERLPLADQARLLVITRQFDDSLGKYEQLLREGFPKHGLGMEAAAEQHLLVSIGVLADTRRPQKLFRELREMQVKAKGDASILNHWIHGLDELTKDRSLLAPQLANAEQLLVKAKALTDHAYDRRGLVYWTALRSVLYRMTREPQIPKIEAKLYYWLGIAATVFEHSFWVAQMPFYLERAIEIAPERGLALQAYYLLEKNITLGYTGSGGTHVPTDEQERLQAMRRLAMSKPLAGQTGI